MNFFQLAFFIAYLSNVSWASADGLGSGKQHSLVITVFSQSEGYHAALANKQRDSLLEQVEELESVSIRVILTHELNLNNTWTVGPFLPHLVANWADSDWYLFCEVDTVVRLGLLIKSLDLYDPLQYLWLGHALYDHEPTIIHHFAQHTKKFKYPNVASGFVISAPLVQRLAQRVSTGETPEGEFSIDAAHEFATFVWDDGKGERLTHASELCVVSGEDCATYPQHFLPCGKSVSVDNVYVAVKTCSQFHKERVTVVKKTWAKYAVNIGFYSDKTDTSQPGHYFQLLYSFRTDESLPEAIITPNTTRGHCAKTFSILQQSNEILKRKQMDWLVITDDDTVLSLGRLLQLLTCYNPSHPLALGERYGFRLWENSGYNYLTGGAGLVLSANVVQKLIEPGFCSCPLPSTPDDMFLFGVCLKRAGIQPTHLPVFHQARPADYPRPYLASQLPVSFHKFWLNDPEQVYKEWFAEADQLLPTPNRHTEL